MRKVGASGSYQQNEVTLSINAEGLSRFSNRELIKLSVEEARDLMADLEYAINYAESD